jgi:hypothetical protein
LIDVTHHLAAEGDDTNFALASKNPLFCTGRSDNLGIMNFKTDPMMVVLSTSSPHLQFRFSVHPRVSKCKAIFLAHISFAIGKFA